MAKTRARLTDDNDPLSSTESVFASLEQVSKSASQQADNTASQQETAQTKPVNLPTSQEVDKPKIRKSTFQLREEVLQQLDRYHLQLQLELGKAAAPYKEVIVEEAIAQFLAQADPADAQVIKNLKARQENR